MRIIVVGGTGTIGEAVVELLKKEHEVIVVGASNGDIQVDISSVDSIRKMYETLGPFDHLISTVGKAQFGKLTEMTGESYKLGLDNKLMGQVNLVLEGLKSINDNGSFTLTTGILNREPILGATSAAMVNSAIEGFVKAAALEMPKNIRLNVVSPTVITEALNVYGNYFKGYESVDAKIVANAYLKSISSHHNGAIYKVGF